MISMFEYNFGYFTPKYRYKTQTGRRQFAEDQT